MNPLALALKAIQAKMSDGTMGGPNRPTVPGLFDPEAGLRAIGMDRAYNQPLKMIGNGVDVSAFNDDPADTNMDGVVSAQEALAKRMKETQGRLKKLREEDATLKTKRDLAEKEWLALTRPETVKAKKRTDSQNFIPAALALLARGLGARDKYVSPALGGYWGRVDQQNQAEADQTNEDAQKQFALDAQKRSLALKEAGDAVARSAQDLAGLEGKVYDSENDLIGVIEKERGATERKQIDRRVREYVADQNNWSKHPAKVFAELEAIDPGNPDNVRKASSLQTMQVAQADFSDARTKTENELRAGRVQKLADDHAISLLEADKLERFLFEAPALFKAKLAKLAADTAKALRPPAARGSGGSGGSSGGGGKAPTAPQLRAALNSEIAALDEAIKEVEKHGTGLVADALHGKRAVELRARRDELKEELSRVNTGQISGKALAP